MRREYVESGGLTWLVHVAGEGAPLLMLHRPPFSGASLQSLAEHAARRFLVVAPDLPGCGGTGALAEAAWRVEDCALACIALADDLGLGRFAVAGEGEGGYVALAMARTIPDRVTAVAVIAPPAGPAEPPGPGLPDAQPHWDGRHLAGLWAWLRESACFSPWH